MSADTPTPLAPDTYFADATNANGDRALETWARADWRKLAEATRYCAARNVGVLLVCGACQNQVTVSALLEADGARRAECPCTVRRWVR